MEWIDIKDTSGLPESEDPKKWDRFDVNILLKLADGSYELASSMVYDPMLEVYEDTCMFFFGEFCCKKSEVLKYMPIES